MSIYNLENQISFNYYAKHRANLLHLSDKEYAHNYFLIGEKIDKKEQKFSQVMVELLCIENCELINYINDKLNGKLEKKVNSIDLVDSDVKQGNTYNITQIIKSNMVWEDTKW